MSAIPKPLKQIGLLTVVETVYHHHPSLTPLTTDNRFTRHISTDEQPYSRFVVVGEEWQPIDYGWLKDKPIGMMVIENCPPQLMTHPTLEEKRVLDAAVIEVGLPPFAQVLPGESCRFHPHESVLNNLRIRCRQGNTRCRVTLIPG
jgi:hypothetical protein